MRWIFKTKRWHSDDSTDFYWWTLCVVYCQDARRIIETMLDAANTEYKVVEDKP